MATVVLAEDHEVVRQGLRTLLEGEPNLSVVAETGDGLEAVRLVEQHKPEVLVVDLALPGLNGLEITRQVKQRAHGTQVVILSMHRDDAYVVEALRNGASAYVLKGSGVEDLVQAIHAVRQGKRFLSPPLAPIEAFAAEAPPGIKERHETLTTRERDVLRLVVAGYTSPQIAETLFISARTVDTHRSNLMAKLGVHSQADLVRYAVQHGLLDSAS